MYILLVFLLMADGTGQSMAVQFKTLDACERGMPKTADLVERNRALVP